MNKTMLAIAAAIAMLVTTCSEAKATFLVTVIINGVTQTGLNAPAPTNPGAINGASYNLSQSFGSISVAINSNATTTPGIVSKLDTNNFTITNDANGAISDVTVTISQDGFQFPGAVSFTSPVKVIAAFGGNGSTYGNTITSSATGLLSYVNSVGVNLPGSGTFPNSGTSGTGGPAPYFVTQSVSLTGFAASSTFVSNNVSTLTTVTPLPATGLMAAVGFPLLGLAGAFRRRVLG